MTSLGVVLVFAGFALVVFASESGARWRTRTHAARAGMGIALAGLAVLVLAAVRVAS